jgi:plastocyanin
VRLGETVQFIGGAGIDTASDAEGNITITNSAESGNFNNLTDINTAGVTIDEIYEAAIVTLRVDNVGTTAYNFNSHYSGNNPTIYAISGTTIAFDLNEIPGHPFQIQNSAGVNFNSGLVHVSVNGTISTGAAAQGKDSGTIYWRIAEGVSGTYRYQCASHAPMVGTIIIKRLSLI